MSPTRKTVAPMEEKMGCGGLPPPEARGSAIVMASEGSLLGVGDATVPGKVTSEESTPGWVIASDPSASLGVAADLSPLDTATPSCALRAAPSGSPAISYTSPGRATCGGEPPLPCPIITKYTLIPGISACVFEGG